MKLTDEDRRTFLDATRDVTPIKQGERVPHARQRPSPRARMARAARREILEESLSVRWQENAEGEVEFLRPALPPRTLRDLRHGRYRVDAELDLHGCNREQARQALKSFVHGCLDRGITCARIIHGKGSRSGPGGPVLKQAVQDWLARWDAVLGYTSAARRFGGSGALLILLRRR